MSWKGAEVLRCNSNALGDERLSYGRRGYEEHFQFPRLQGGCRAQPRGFPSQCQGEILRISYRSLQSQQNHQSGHDCDFSRITPIPRRRRVHNPRPAMQVKLIWRDKARLSTLRSLSPSLPLNAQSKTQRPRRPISYPKSRQAEPNSKSRCKSMVAHVPFPGTAYYQRHVLVAFSSL